MDENERPMVSEHKFPRFDGGPSCLSIRWNDGEMLVEENGEEILIDTISVSLCAELLRVAAERDRRDDVLRAAVETAGEWAAAYPLGGHMDVAAAAEVYEICSAAAEILRRSGETT